MASAWSVTKFPVDNEFTYEQGGRSWQPFGERKNAHKSFRQARIYYFRDKCVVFVHDCKS